MPVNAFEKIYSNLNSKQKLAVDTIDGPVLVIAGPGTGKTQLLGARVANILQKTDTPARNILCLTFTENGASNMRDRLSQFIGKDAYDVSIGTYHAFGGDIINRFPQFFSSTNLREPVDNLGRHQIIANIVAAMPYSNPLKQTQHHIKDLISTISEIKRALLTPDDLRAIAAENSNTIAKASPEIEKIFEGVVRMPSKVDKSLPYFKQVFNALAHNSPTVPCLERFGSMAGVAMQELQMAIDDATDTNSTKSLTAWKNNWLEKTSDNTYCLSGELENTRVAALADALKQYTESLEKRGLYDFDDMILNTIKALEENDDLRYSLQEQYLYVLLDEFQDTNAAQLRLVELLTNNPLYEGRPNVMAVGDDDQAIYAFQGAQYSNMMDFYNLYRNVMVINLEENYRSHAAILKTASNITEQMSARLFTTFHGITKNLTAKNTKLPNQAKIERLNYQSDVAERSAVAEKIASLVKTGVSPNEIAVLAPKHRILEQLMPFLNANDIPVQYEKRENIIEAPLINEILNMARLIEAIRNAEDEKANALWPEVLSSPSWKIPVSKIWDLSWKVYDNHQTSWTKELLNNSGIFREAALLMTSLAYRSNTETLETILDYLSGNEPVKTNETDFPEVLSPIKNSYLNPNARIENSDEFYELLSQLTVLRSQIREHQATQSETLRLHDLLSLVEAYEAAEEPILHTSPYHQAAEAVQLMTVYKAKGLEFEHVFLISCQDDIWGNSGKNNGNRITLPANLSPIRHSGATEDERLRLFFVAITRAKVGLHLTSYSSGYNGKQSKALKYLDERQDENGNIISHALPEEYQSVTTSTDDKPDIKALRLSWRSKHFELNNKSELKDLLKDRLANYQLSPTHLTSFLDLQYGGPEHFFTNTILRFPSAPTVDSQFGNAIHQTLQWVQQQTNAEGITPSIKAINTKFEEILKKYKILDDKFELELQRGLAALSAYMAERSRTFKPDDKPEMNFKHEGVFVGEAHLGGVIDKLEIDTKSKTITVVDYKTGNSHNKWSSEIQLYKYRKQLYCYKLLIENSATFKNYKVTSGRLEFVEPDRKSNRIQHLDLDFNLEELNQTKKLLEAMWQNVKNLDFPDISNYPKTLTGVKQFEQDLIKLDLR